MLRALLTPLSLVLLLPTGTAWRLAPGVQPRLACSLTTVPPLHAAPIAAARRAPPATMALYYYERMPPYKPGPAEIAARLLAALIGGAMLAGIATVIFALAAPFLLLLGIAGFLGFLGAMVTGDYITFSTTSSTVTRLDERGVPQRNTQRKSWVRTNNPELRRQLEQRAAQDPDSPKVLRWWERPQ